MKKPAIYIVMFITILLGACGEDEPESTLEPLAIVPPFENVLVEVESFGIDPTVNSKVALESGTTVTIPANSLVDANGHPITEPVNLECTEYNSPADIVASGIPMTFQAEDGNSEQMESAGMIEIRGSAGGDAISIADNASLNVNMATGVQGAYDLFYFEETKQPAPTIQASVLGAISPTAGASQRGGNWKKLTDVGETQMIECNETTSFKFDTASYPETIPLQDLDLCLAELGSFNKPEDWQLNMQWARLELTKPGRYYEVLEEAELLPSDYYRTRAYFSPDTLLYITGPSTIGKYDWTGEKVDSYDFGRPYSDWGYQGNALGSWWNFENRDDHKLMVFSAEGSRDELILNDALDVVKEIADGYSFRTQPGGNVSYVSRDGADHSFVMINPQGETILDIPMGEWFTYETATDYILIDQNDKISVYSMKGDKLATRDFDLPGWRSWASFLNNGKEVVIGGVNELAIWDWSNDELITPPKQLLNEYENKHFYNTSANSTSPMVIYYTDKDIEAFWNYETGKFVEYGSGTRVGWWHNEEFISVYMNDQVTIYDLDFNEILSYVGSDGDGGTGGWASYSLASEFFIVSGLGQSAVYDHAGEVLMDFSAAYPDLRNVYYDAMVRYFYGIDTLGGCLVWNENYELVGGAEIGKYNFVYSVNEKYIVAGSGADLNVWTLDGELCCILPESWECIMQPNGSGHFYTAKTKGATGQICRIGDKVEDPAAYQLTLAVGDTSYTSWVRLNDDQLAVINTYNVAKEARIAEEQGRVAQEISIVRSFEANNFGIYNYDKFYKQEGNTQLAASFDFGTGTEFNDINVFLVTGWENNCVIKYTEATFDKFSFNPNMPNMMFAVLPEDRIGVFRQEDFDALHIDKLKVDGKCLFFLELLDPIESTSMLNDIIGGSPPA